MNKSIEAIRHICQQSIEIRYEQRNLIAQKFREATAARQYDLADDLDALLKLFPRDAFDSAYQYNASKIGY
jgi:hypothetical protein